MSLDGYSNQRDANERATFASSWPLHVLRLGDDALAFVHDLLRIRT